MPGASSSSVGIGQESNGELWLHENHWDSGDEVECTIVATDVNVGAVVAAGKTRRIREITVRHMGTANTIITLRLAGAAVARVSFMVPAQSSRVWSSQDGREFVAAEQAVVQSSNVTGGSTFISAAGVEE